MVRGSAIRVTGLGSVGDIPDPIPYAVSKSVVSVSINEVTDAGNNEVLRTDEDERRLLFVQSASTIRFTADINFLRVDPGVLSLVANTPLTMNAAGDYVGFDQNTRRKAASFALEVWTRLARGGAKIDAGFGEAPFGVAQFGGQRPLTGQWGYTVLPFLKGGYLSGFKFENGLVSFNLAGAQTRRSSRWGVGPYDLEGPHERMLSVIPRNTAFRLFITPTPPPAQVDGTQTTTDVIDGGTATVTSADVLAGGTAPVTSGWIIEGGRAR
jgi:hypothetical protein